MNKYIQINRTNWRSKLAQYSKFLLRWGWFVVLTIIATTVCTMLLPDPPALDSYQATLQVQIQLPGNFGALSQTQATTLFSTLFVAPDTLNLTLPKINKIKQFNDLQLSDLQSLVTATPVTNTAIVELSAVSDTPQDASILVTTVYQAFLQRYHNGHSFVVDGLRAALLNQLIHVQNDATNSGTDLQNLSASGDTSSFQYRLLSKLHASQQSIITTINTQLQTLGQQGLGNNDILQLVNNQPEITTVEGTGPTMDQRLPLSPLVGLIMGLAGALLASRFSTKLPLRGKKREMILPHISAIIPVHPQIGTNRLQILKDTSSECLPLLRRLRYQAAEHEKRLQVIIITSPKGQEGKSTIATSLAIAAAQSGLLTVLVDANPRQPVLHSWFQLSNTIGTLDAIRSLAAGVVGSSPILKTSITKLGLLPIGNAKRSADPLEEPLRADGLRPFTEVLLQQSDLIIYDGPSILRDTNAVNLVSFADVVLLVVDAQRSESTHVVKAEDLLAKMDVSFATVLNCARRESLE